MSDFDVFFCTINEDISYFRRFYFWCASDAIGSFFGDAIAFNGFIGGSCSRAYAGAFASRAVSDASVAAFVFWSVFGWRRPAGVATALGRYGSLAPIARPYIYADSTSVL